MNNEKNNLEKEILSEEYKLGKKYYKKILEKAKEDLKKYE